MNSQLEKIKAFIKDHDSKKNRIVAGSVCAVLVLGIVGVGVGLNMANSAPIDPAKALTQAEANNDNKADENTENKDGSTEQSDSAAATTEEVTVNENGEVVDSAGNVIAESVEAYNATPQAQSRPVNATSGNSSSPSNTPSSQPSAGGSSQPVHVHTWATRTISEAWDEQKTEYKMVNCYYECLKCGAKDQALDWKHDLECKGASTLREIYDYVPVGTIHHEAITETYCTSCGAKA